MLTKHSQIKSKENKILDRDQSPKHITLQRYLKSWSGITRPSTIQVTGLNLRVLDENQQVIFEAPMDKVGVWLSLGYLRLRSGKQKINFNLLSNGEGTVALKEWSAKTILANAALLIGIGVSLFSGYRIGGILFLISLFTLNAFAIKNRRKLSKVMTSVTKLPSDNIDLEEFLKLLHEHSTEELPKYLSRFNGALLGFQNSVFLILMVLFGPLLLWLFLRFAILGTGPGTYYDIPVAIFATFLVTWFLIRPYIRWSINYKKDLYNQRFLTEAVGSKSQVHAARTKFISLKKGLLTALGFALLLVLAMFRAQYDAKNNYKKNLAVTSEFLSHVRAKDYEKAESMLCEDYPVSTLASNLRAYEAGNPNTRRFLIIPEDFQVIDKRDASATGQRYGNLNAITLQSKAARTYIIRSAVALSPKKNCIYEFQIRPRGTILNAYHYRNTTFRSVLPATNYPDGPVIPTTNKIPTEPFTITTPCFTVTLPGSLLLLDDANKICEQSFEIAVAYQDIVPSLKKHTFTVKVDDYPYNTLEELETASDKTIKELFKDEIKSKRQLTVDGLPAIEYITENKFKGLEKEVMVFVKAKGYKNDEGEKITYIRFAGPGEKYSAFEPANFEQIISSIRWK